jgi:transcriptional regulator with XRE-family HTH domain
MNNTTTSKELRALAIQAESAPSEDPDAFVAVLTVSLQQLGLHHHEFADQLRLSRTSVARWLAGKNLPVRAMRRPILRWIGKQARQASIQAERLENIS